MNAGLFEIKVESNDFHSDNLNVSEHIENISDSFKPSSYVDKFAEVMTHDYQKIVKTESDELFSDKSKNVACNSKGFCFINFCE